MGVSVGILTSVAASAAFYLIEPHVLALVQPWKAVAVLAVFILSSGIALYLNRRSAAEDSGDRSIMSGNQVERDMTAKIDATEVAQPANKVMSGNIVGGSANFDIKDSKF